MALIGVGGLIYGTLVCCAIALAVVVSVYELVHSRKKQQRMAALINKIKTHSFF